MKVLVYKEKPTQPIDSKSVKLLVKEFFLFHKLPHDEVSIYFVTTTSICDLHDQHFNDPSTTDCISFPMDSSSEDGYLILGEVFVCPETAFCYAEKHDSNPLHEITLYVVHGLLHLIGYDDLDVKCRRKMRQAEKDFLSHVATHHLWIKVREPMQFSQ